MFYKGIGFDLDKTLIKPISGKRFPESIEDAMWLPGRLQVLYSLKLLGIKTAIITNQGGVAAGHRSLEDSIQFLRHVQEAGLVDYLYCCHSMDKDDPRRKPNPQMIHEFIYETGLTNLDILYVGDFRTDKEAAEKAHVDFMWAEKHYGNPYFFSEEVPLYDK